MTKTRSRYSVCTRIDANYLLGFTAYHLSPCFDGPEHKKSFSNATIFVPDRPRSSAFLLITSFYARLFFHNLAVSQRHSHPSSPLLNLLYAHICSLTPLCSSHNTSPAYVRLVLRASYIQSTTTLSQHTVPKSPKSPSPRKKTLSTLMGLIGDV